MIRIIFCLLFDEYRKSAAFKAQSWILLNKIFCKKSLFHEFYPIFGLFGLIIMAVFLRCRPVNAYGVWCGSLLSCHIVQKQTDSARSHHHHFFDFLAGAFFVSEVLFFQMDRVPGSWLSSWPERKKTLFFLEGFI